MCKLLDTVRTANVKEAVAKQALYMLGICTNLRGGRCICRHRSSRTPSLYTRHCSCSCICTPGDPQIYPGPASLTAACDAVMVCMQACTILAQLPHSAAWPRSTFRSDLSAACYLASWRPLQQGVGLRESTSSPGLALMRTDRQHSLRQLFLSQTPPPCTCPSTGSEL